jgi:hypothetical protein
MCVESLPPCLRQTKKRKQVMAFTFSSLEKYAAGNRYRISRAVETRIFCTGVGY